MSWLLEAKTPSVGPSKLMAILFNWLVPSALRIALHALPLPTRHVLSPSAQLQLRCEREGMALEKMDMATFCLHEEDFIMFPFLKNIPIVVREPWKSRQYSSPPICDSVPGCL